MLIWQSYQTDLGRIYPFYPVNLFQVNSEAIESSINPLNLLPSIPLSNLIDFSNPCTVPGLKARQIYLVSSDGAEFRFNYFQPFDQTLYNHLMASLQVTAFQFIGESIKDSRLRKMLNNL